MRIRYKAASGDPWILLCGEGVTTSEHQSLRMSERQVTEPVPPWQAAGQVPLARANWSLDLTFTCQRPFSDAEAAEKFARRHRATLPDAGVLLFDYEEGDSDPDYIATAALVSVDRDVQGANVVLTYTFLGSPFTATDPFA